MLLRRRSFHDGNTEQSERSSVEKAEEAFFKRLDKE
jgi:hypothetical protein